MGRRGLTIIELLVVTAVIALLVAILVPVAGQGRARAVSARCAGHLHQVGVLMFGYIASHGDVPAPTIWGFDFLWDREPLIGWDITVGTWASIRGGANTIWCCPAQRVPYVGNARALGVDRRLAFADGQLHLVPVRWWHRPALLGLVYDAQTDMLEPPWVFPNARLPDVGDISDERLGWIKENDVHGGVHPLALDRLGPHHGEAYGVLFADGHAGVRLYLSAADGVYWSGPRWWNW